MDTNVNFHIAWDDWNAWSKEMSPYWAEDMIYDFNYVGEWNFGPTRGLKAWFEGEHMHYNRALPDCQFMDFIRAATNQTCTSASYGLARWSGPFAGVPPPQGSPWVRVRDLDFYLLDGDRIKVNWCIIDVVDLFDQAGYKVLPAAPMPTKGYLPPSSMDGFPAPLSAAVDPAVTVRSERIWKNALHEDFSAGSNEARWWAENLTWYGPGGIGTAHSRGEYVEHFLKPLRAGFSNVTMDTDLVVCEGNYCGAHFYLNGNHSGTWLGEEATWKIVPIRCGAHARIEDGHIVEGWLIIDQPRAFHAMGIDLYERARKLALGQTKIIV
jgi:predicted ester cyclase